MLDNIVASWNKIVLTNPIMPVHCWAQALLDKACYVSNDLRFLKGPQIK